MVVLVVGGRGVGRLLVDEDLYAGFALAEEGGFRELFLREEVGGLLFGALCAGVEFRGVFVRRGRGRRKAIFLSMFFLVPIAFFPPLEGNHLVRASERALTSVSDGWQ